MGKVLACALVLLGVTSAHAEPSPRPRSRRENKPTVVPSDEESRRAEKILLDARDAYVHGQYDEAIRIAKQAFDYHKRAIDWINQLHDARRRGDCKAMKTAANALLDLDAPIESRLLFERWVPKQMPKKCRWTPDPSRKSIRPAAPIDRRAVWERWIKERMKQPGRLERERGGDYWTPNQLKQLRQSDDESSP